LDDDGKFDDSNQQNPMDIVYQSSGDVLVKLKVTDANGKSNYASHLIHPTYRPNPPIQEDYRYDRRYNEHEVVFSATDPDADRLLFGLDEDRDGDFDWWFPYDYEYQWSGIKNIISWHIDDETPRIVTIDEYDAQSVESIVPEMKVYNRPDLRRLSDIFPLFDRVIAHLFFKSLLSWEIKSISLVTPIN
jgi:hypothetical protein